jgi:hypothetical protein
MGKWVSSWKGATKDTESIDGQYSRRSLVVQNLLINIVQQVQTYCTSCRVYKAPRQPAIAPHGWMALQIWKPCHDSVRDGKKYHHSNKQTRYHMVYVCCCWYHVLSSDFNMYINSFKFVITTQTSPITRSDSIITPSVQQNYSESDELPVSDCRTLRLLVAVCLEGFPDPSPSRKITWAFAMRSSRSSVLKSSLPPSWSNPTWQYHK